MTHIKEAIILAGGLGTRLRSAVPDLPKCMAVVAGKPFLYYVISYFRRQGIEKFILALGYKHELVENYVREQYGKEDQSGKPEIRFSVEQEALGTGGAIRLACSKVMDRDTLVVNGDTFFGVSLAALSLFHETKISDCTLCLKPMHAIERYGVVLLDQDHAIRRFEEKKFHPEGLINGGVYALNAKRFSAEKFSEKFSFENDYLEILYPQRRMYGLVQDGYFIDIGLPDDYVRAQEELSQHI